MSVCSICHGGCCRRYIVDLTGYDIINISNAMQLEIPVFTQTVPVKNEDVESMSKDAALFKFTDNNCQYYYRFALKQIKSKLIQGTLKCLFLHEWDGETLELKKLDKIIGRCGAYSVRPFTCAIYPARLDKNGVLGYVLDPYYNCERKANPAYNVCPRPLQQEDFADPTGELTRYLALHKYEMEFFKGLAKNWNENPRSINEFFSYINRVYKHRIIFNPELKPEE